MSSDVQQRIADIVDVHRSFSRHAGVFCKCGQWKWSPQVNWSQHLAGVLVSELGLECEERMMGTAETPTEDDDDDEGLVYYDVYGNRRVCPGAGCNDGSCPGFG